MKNKTLEIVITTSVFSLLNILYFLFHFSKWGAIPVVLTLGYYFLRVSNNTSKGRDGYTLSEWIGAYFGALLTDMFLIKACYDGIIPSIPVLPSSIASTWAIILLIAEVVVLIKLKKTTNLGYNVAVFLKYIILFGATVGCSYIFIRWTGASVVFALFPMLFISLIIELFVNKYNEKLSYSIFSWTMVICVLFNITNGLYSEYSIAMVRWLYNFSLNLQFKWYVAIVLLAVFVFGIVATITLRQKEKSKSGDTKLYIFFLFTTLFLWISSSFVTKFHPVFIIIFSIVNVLSLTHDFKDSNVNMFNVNMSRSNINYAVALVITSGLPLAFYLGFILQYFIVSFTMLFIMFQYGAYKIECEEVNEEEGNTYSEPHKKWFFWQVLLTLLAMYAVIVATVKNRFIGNYIFIAAVYLLATFAFYIINIQNPLRPKNHSVIRIIIAVPVIVIFLFSINQSSIQVSYKVDNIISLSENLPKENVQESEDILLRININNNDVRIEKAYYYWLQDKDNVKEIKVGDNHDNVIKPRNDCLCIVCESESGVLFTDKRWFFNRELEVYSDVGVARENGISELSEN